MTIQELENFINQYGSNIYSFCKRLCPNRDAADELYQDVWLKAMQDIKEIDAGRNVRSYLISLAIGIWKNDKKKYAVRNRIAPQSAASEEAINEVASEEAGALDSLINTERDKIVISKVDELDEKYRLPILLYYMEEKSIKEIAGLLSIPEGTVKRRLWTARKKLAVSLEEYINE